jgi:hypothetical protein
MHYRVDGLSCYQQQKKELGHCHPFYQQEVSIRWHVWEKDQLIDKNIIPVRSSRDKHNTQYKNTNVVKNEKSKTLDNKIGCETKFHLEF